MNQKIRLITGSTGQKGAFSSKLMLGKGAIVHEYGNLTNVLNLKKIIQEIQPEEMDNSASLNYLYYK